MYLYILLLSSTLYYYCGWEEQPLVFYLLPGTSPPKIKKITRDINDVVEDQTEIVTSMNIRFINNLLRRKQKLFIRQSNVYANFDGIIQIISYATVTFQLVYYVTNYDVTIGSVFSTYNYMFDFCNAVIGITNIIPAIIDIKDVIRRIDE